MVQGGEVKKCCMVQGCPMKKAWLCEKNAAWYRVALF
jgi:hypothetical protein